MMEKTNQQFALFQTVMLQTMKDLIINMVKQIINQQRSILYYLPLKTCLVPNLELPSWCTITDTSISSATPTEPDTTTHTIFYHSTYLHTASIHSRHHLTNNPNDSTTTSTKSKLKLFYPFHNRKHPSRIQWPRSTLTFESDIPHTPDQSNNHDSCKYKTFFQYLFSKNTTKNTFHNQYITKLLYNTNNQH